MKLVKDVMMANPVPIGPEEPIRKALEAMQRGGFRRIPVVDGGRLIGILSERDLREAMNTPVVVREKRYDDYLLDHVQVGTCMTRHVFTAFPSDSIEKAARLMRDHKVGGLPVVEEDHVVGMITESDLLNYLIECLQAGKIL